MLTQLPCRFAAAQSDGALAASGGMDALARVWDCRSGRNIFTCQGHVKAVLSLDFSPCGYLLATGSEDNTARVWDLRKRSVLVVLPGHTSLVSQVRFEPDSGSYLLTAGYDNTSRLWGGPRFRLLRTLAGHEGKVMGADVSPDGSFTVATTGYDRTIKVRSIRGRVMPAAHPSPGPCLTPLLSAPPACPQLYGPDPLADIEASAAAALGQEAPA